MLFVVLEPDLADSAIAVTGTRFRLHNFSHWNLEHFRIDSELMHSLLLFSIVLAKFVRESKARSCEPTISPKNWHCQLHIAIASATKLLIDLHHWELGSDFLARLFLLHREQAVFFGNLFFNLLGFRDLFDFSVLNCSTFCHR